MMIAECDTTSGVELVRCGATQIFDPVSRQGTTHGNQEGRFEEVEQAERHGRKDSPARVKTVTKTTTRLANQAGKAVSAIMPGSAKRGGREEEGLGQEVEFQPVGLGQIG